MKQMSYNLLRRQLKGASTQILLLLDRAKLASLSLFLAFIWSYANWLLMFAVASFIVNLKDTPSEQVSKYLHLDSAWVNPIVFLSTKYSKTPC